MAETEAYLALIAALTGLGIWRGLRVVRNRLHTTQARGRLSCPVRGTDVVCLLERDPRTGHWTDVDRCSALEGSTTCDKECLTLLNDGIPLRPSTPIPPPGAPLRAADSE